ncbi:hypothetical protein AB0E64_15710 [Streptomyces caelestis]|uniref:Uncharacterized protein n=1 Tax=Streptomyces caelestis TaxID=36816 RepID=A0A7W9HBN8_9ACTN|nr:hypothetical protein [Streptomyces caelestis]MBB5799305.1 hypothetical protein [Streptomyces caelestis]
MSVRNLNHFNRCESVYAADSSAITHFGCRTGDPWSLNQATERPRTQGAAA